jgi:putative Ca2+/H+ antiporter (TMEM165/GDT1 family)
VLTDLLTAFGVVFLAELPDKTMFATLLLAARYPRRTAVWGGVTTAYSLHVIVAALLGGLLARLPAEPIRYVVAALFMTAGFYLMWASRRPISTDEHELDSRDASSWRSVFAVSFATIGVAEFADITQIATASLAATRDSVMAVATGAILALACVSGIATLVGRGLVQRVRLHLIQRIAGILFVVIGLVTLI